MEDWGVHRRGLFIRQREEDGSQFPSDSSNEEESDSEEEENTKTQPVFIPEIRKRKRSSVGQLKGAKGGSLGTTSCSKNQTKRESKDRWSAERYKLAEQSMWKVLKEEGAIYGNAITRPNLRLAARKHIGDTGLLDHLLKHIEGKVAPGGMDRFRRWYNTNGIMEYWLESADLERIRQEAGVEDPYWLPPSTVAEGSASGQNTDTSTEMKLLKLEIAQMKNDMKELIAKNQAKNETIMMEATRKEFLKWKAMTDNRLTEIMTSLRSVQGNCCEMVNWKTKVEQRLMEITNKLNDLQAPPRECTAFSPSVRWEDWLQQGPNIENIQEDAIATWIESSQLPYAPNGTVPEGPDSGLPTQPLDEELNNKKSDMELVPVKQEDQPNMQEDQPNVQDDQPNVTPDSSTTVNSKSDIDNSMMMFQDMFLDLFKWKEKMEQQLLEVSNTVYGILAMK